MADPLKNIRSKKPRSKEDKLGHLRFNLADHSESARWDAHIHEQKMWREVRGDVSGDPAVTDSCGPIETPASPDPAKDDAG